jgi:hypothetical protein
MRLYMIASRQAITRVHFITIILIIVIASFAGIWYYIDSVPEKNPAAFSMEVNSRPISPMKGEEEIPRAIVGQRVVFLVVVEEKGNGNEHGEAVNISATAVDASVFVDNSAIKAGEVAEVIVIPDQTSVNKRLSITINGDRGGFRQTETVDIEILDWEDDLSELAVEMRSKFVPWLATNHPELEISGETDWIGTIVNPGILVVMHYMFYSEDWEMYVTWHVMIPPYDWTRIYLRHRFTETRSTMAFEISSVQGEEQPQSIEVPDWV